MAGSDDDGELIVTDDSAATPSGLLALDEADIGR
jgi:hypothetical protein